MRREGSQKKVKLENPSFVSMEGDPGCIQCSVTNPTSKSGSVGSRTGLNVQTAGSCGIAAGWQALCTDVKRIILGQLSLNDLGRVAALCRDFRGEFLVRLAEEQGRLISVGHETFRKDMFSAIVRALQGFVADPVPYPKIGSWSSIDAAGQTREVSCDEAEGCSLGGRSYFIVRNWAEAELLWKFPGSCVNIGRVRIFRWYDYLLGVSVSEGAGEAAMGLLLAMCTENIDATPAIRPFRYTTLRMKGLQGAGRKREAEDLVAPLKAMAHSFSGTLTGCPSQEKVVKGCPLGHLAVRLV